MSGKKYSIMKLACLVGLTIFTQRSPLITVSVFFHKKSQTHRMFSMCWKFERFSFSKKKCLFLWLNIPTCMLYCIVRCITTCNRAFLWRAPIKIEAAFLSVWRAIRRVYEALAVTHTHDGIAAVPVLCYCGPDIGCLGNSWKATTIAERYACRVLTRYCAFHNHPTPPPT